MINHNFWHSPPWQGGVRKFRLGLRPLPQAPFLTPVTTTLLQHKRLLLDSRYDDVVRTTGEYRDLVERNLELMQWPVSPARDYPDAVANAAMTVCEDICIIAVQDMQKLVAGCVCSPSYWRLVEKIARPLAQVHAPAVGVNEKIGASIAQFIERMPEATPFRRANWFLHGDDALFQFASETQISEDVNAWVVRCEIQTLYKLSPTCMLFAIEIVTEPLAHILNFAQAREDMLSSLAQMDQLEINHFGGQDKLDRARRWLQRSS